MSKGDEEAPEPAARDEILAAAIDMHKTTEQIQQNIEDSAAIVTSIFLRIMPEGYELQPEDGVNLAAVVYNRMTM